MEQRLDFEFRSFLLQIGKDLSPKNFGELKYVLKAFVPSAQCSEMKEAHLYFEELQRMCHLTPTSFEVLKSGLSEIGRQDLVEKIEQKEQYFAVSLSQSGGLNLGEIESDAVCDGITKGPKGGRSGKNTPELQNELLQISGSSEDEIRIQEVSDVLPPSDTYDEMTEQKKEKRMKKANDLPLKKEELPSKQPPNFIRTPNDGEGEVSSPHHMDNNTESMEVPLGEAIESGNSEQATSVKAAQDHLMESNTTEPELAGVEKTTFSKTFQKEPCEDAVTDCNDLEDLNTGKAHLNDNMADTLKGGTGLPGEPLPNMCSLDSDVVTDGKEDGDENTAESKVDDEKTKSEAAEHQSPEDDHGPGARPKEKTIKTAVPAETTKEKAMELDDKVAETNHYGTLFPANDPGDYEMLPPETKSSKEPTEGTYSNPTSPVGTVRPDGSDLELYSDDESTGSSKEKPKFSPQGPPQGANASMEPPGCYHPPGVFSTPPSDHGASMYSDHAAPGTGGLSPAEVMSIASAVGLTPTSSELTLQQQMALLHQLLAMQGSVSGAQFASPASTVPQSQFYMSTSQSASTADSPLESNCYSKEGYSVVITNGQLCDSTSEKGVVMMESGTQFCIAIGNDNDHAAEVDITFGGMYLGVWMLEAKQSLSSPLIIEGSSWAEGRLRFFSARDEKRPQPNAEFYGEAPDLNGRIELEFKPEVPVLRLFARHVRDQRKGEEKNLLRVLLTNPNTATVGDLKQEISRRWSSGISFLLKGGKILQEEKTIRSYALNKDEVIQVVNAEEELKIESPGKETVTMMVDPCIVSVEAVKEFISEKIKINVNQQILTFKEKDIEVDSESLTTMLTSKEAPVLKVYPDRPINIDVLLPDGQQYKVEIMLSATVDDLKDKLEDRNICNSNATLKHDDEEISGHGGRKLINLGLKNKSKINVQVNVPRSTHRGFSASAFTGSQTRGFGCFGGFEDHVSPMSLRGFPSGTRAGDSYTDDVGHDYSREHDEDGIAMLCGNEESVYKQFQEDDLERKFLKEKAVTLTIQLKAKSMGATGATASSQPSMPSGAHCSGPTGPMSTPYPPPVPE